MDMQRRRLAYALLISTFLLLINAIAVVTGYADEVYCGLQTDCRDQCVQNNIHNHNHKYATKPTFLLWTNDLE